MTETLILSLLKEDPTREFLLRIPPGKWRQLDTALAKSPLCLLFFSILKKKDCLEVLPEEIKAKWQGGYYSNLKRNILAVGQIKEIQQALRWGGVEFILLKGLGLAAGLYNDLGVRYSMDIDLLVRKRDLPKLKTQLEKMDYRLSSPERAGLIEEFGCGDWGFSRSDGLPLDVHWQLCQYERFKGIIRFDEEEIFRRAADIDLEGVRVKTLSDEDLFLYLAMHFGLVHNFSGLNWLYDLKLIIDKRTESFDWDLLVKKARQANLSKVLYYVLDFGKKWLDIRVPDGVCRKIKPLADFRPLANRRDYIAQAWLVDGFGNSLRVFYRMLFPSRAWLVYHYADKQNLYYLLWLRHIFRGIFCRRS